MLLPFAPWIGIKMPVRAALKPFSDDGYAADEK
jgi:hypothetical protein